MRVLYYDAFRLSEDQEDALGVHFVLFPELLRTSDVVSLHMPLNEETRNMMGTREFATMKNDAIFINTCRGPGGERGGAAPRFDQRSDCRRRSRRDGRRAAATDHPLFALDNVTFTPHTAGPDAGELDQSVPQRLRQHPAGRRRTAAHVGHSRIARAGL